MLAAAVRLLPWEHVFTPEGVRLVFDSDPHYHVLRASRIAEGRDVLFDRLMNFPVGAKVVWPPLFDAVIAACALPFRGRLGIDAVAAFVPVLFGCATVVLVAVGGSCVVGRRPALLAALVLAILPLNVDFTVLGRADQHAGELFFSTWTFLGFAAALRSETARRRRVAVAATGVGLALAFWNWQGSALYLVVLGAWTAGWHAYRRADAPDGSVAARTLTFVCGAAAVLLAASLAIVMPGELVSIDGSGVTGFHVMLCGCTALFGGGLWIADRHLAGSRATVSRLAEIVAAAVIAAATSLVIPGVWSAVTTNLTALGASNSWYASIREFRPMFFGSGSSVGADVGLVASWFGLTPIAALVSAGFAVVQVRRERRSDPVLAFLVSWLAMMVAFALYRRRFTGYSAIPIALWGGIGVDRLANAASVERLLGRARGLRAAVAAAASVALVGPALPSLLRAPPQPQGLRELSPILQWLRAVPQVPGRESVLAPWPYGHLVMYYAGRPVLTTPFGIEGGAGAMEDAARILLAEDEGSAQEVLRARRIGYVLLRNPGPDANVLAPFREGPDPVVERRGPDGRLRFEPTPEFWRLLGARLYFLDGGIDAELGLPATGGFRLMYEDLSVDLSSPKLFGVVPGADLHVSGATPSSTVTARIDVVTNSGRSFAWIAQARASADGEAELRVPYATGANGFARAGSTRISDGPRTTELSISERQVSLGERVTAELR